MGCSIPWEMRERGKRLKPKKFYRKSLVKDFLVFLVFRMCVWGKKGHDSRSRANHDVFNLQLTTKIQTFIHWFSFCEAGKGSSCFTRTKFK